MKINYYTVGGSGREADDGGAIFDGKTVTHLRRKGADVEDTPLLRQRSMGLPLWAGSVRERGGSDAARDDLTVLSHEATFGLAQSVSVDAIIVHNYFSHFLFPGRRLLEAYFRTGSRRYFGRAFRNARHVFFLSHRERRLAELDFPFLAGKTAVVVPPPANLPLSARRVDLVHVSGTDYWRPKRLSRLTEAERQSFSAAGFALGDFGPSPAPAFGLVHDRFTVGFKLKLMQMIHCRDVIASLAVVAEEIEAIAPGYPFYREVRSVAEAIDFFAEVRRSHSPEEIDRRFTEASSRWEAPTWDLHADIIMSRLDH